MSVQYVLAKAIEHNDLWTAQSLRRDTFFNIQFDREDPDTRKYFNNITRLPMLARRRVAVQYRLVLIRKGIQTILRALEAGAKPGSYHDTSYPSLDEIAAWDKANGINEDYRNFFHLNYKKKLDNLRRRSKLKSSKRKGIPPTPTGDAAF